MASQTESDSLAALIDEISDMVGLSPALKVPDGVQARRIGKNQYFYVNTTPEEKEVILPGAGRLVLADREVKDRLVMAAYDADLLVTEE